MDYRQLEVFCKVVEQKSFSRAASLVGLSQPTVSGHILSLERELGLRLLERSGRQVVPTKAGKLLYGYARRLLRIRDEAREALESLKGELRGRLEVAASTIPGTYILPSHIRAFAAKHPEVTVALRIEDSEAVIGSVMEREVELGLAGVKPPSGKLLFEPVARDELVLVVPPGHRWAGLDSVEIKEICRESLLLREEGSATRRRFEEALQACGIKLSELSVVAELSTNEAIKQAVASGLGVSVLSNRAVAKENDLKTLKSLALRGAPLERTFYVMWRRAGRLSALSQAFLDFLLKEVAPLELS